MFVETEEVFLSYYHASLNECKVLFQIIISLIVIGETFYDIITNKYQNGNMCKKAKVVNNTLFLNIITFTIRICLFVF